MTQAARHEQADDIVSKLEAGAVAGAHTWISESSAPRGSEQRFEDGWHAGVRDVASYLLHIADTTSEDRRARGPAVHRGRPLLGPHNLARLPAGGQQPGPQALVAAFATGKNLVGEAAARASASEVVGD
ncbi:MULTISPECIES: hypothetical protein [Streptomyces]|uniref:Uncharacterized protein n=1 Tax=Streptomyces canarius TaxID=285453 RepID=A0ABQ3DA05_9ACTN|nr:hypothetical protein [Streptomyces canarius]GHA70429.1 hypothetical protein GCM10010345_87210 [Streptomyces canarius]